jgi:hypothetical protein
VLLLLLLWWWVKFEVCAIGGVGLKADVFSLGCVFQAMATGRAPYAVPVTHHIYTLVLILLIDNNAIDER